MDRADFELVVAIARTGSLTAASRQLHIAQPPLSRRLQQLERTVGAPLFLRGRHGATPTPVGRALVESAEVALAAMERAEQDAADAAAGRAGRLRIGVTPSLGAVLLPDVLASFRRTHAKVRLDLVASGDSAALRQQVAAGDLDIAVAGLAPSTEPHIRVALTGEQRFVVIAPVDLRLPPAVQRRALVDLPLVTLTSGEGLRQQLDLVFAELGAEPNIALETSEREMLVPFVAAGLGVALIPEGFARARPAKGLRIHDVDPVVRRAVGAMVPDVDATALVDQFLVALETGTDLARTTPRAPRRRTRSPAR
ncbi:MAG TPA: LysR family transcriptional regulator [Acidimicrobiales bacterium]|nr:LysR family transcriptional regulator [Acidimicrobiales bacterium]